ncbi:MAG: alkaline phosphatase [Gemmatimonadaceae bacterium]|nr:alkaline phosphatase [Acetobacteraceae bacterium]
MRATVIGLIASLASTAVGAQVIYPIDRAEILAGSRFDLKVEFPGVVDPARMRVTVNGQDHAAALGRAADFLAREDNKDVSAAVLRNVTIDQPGTYAVTATDGARTATVTWEVYAAPTPRRAKNVVLLVADGMAVANVTAARILSGQIEQGRYRRTLTMDGLPHMAAVGTSGSDSIATDSANSASAFHTGHKSAVNAMGVYASRAAGTLDHPKVETLGEIVKRRLGMSVGIVTNTEIQDATPAAVFAHTRRRADYVPITDQLLAFEPDVILGGGSASFLPQATPGSRRRDERDMIAAFRDKGYAFADTAAALSVASDPATKKLLGLFTLGNMDGALDRFYLKKGTVGRFPDQPDLTEQTSAALRVLERNPAGFFLAIEAGLIDKANHPLDWERSVYDTIMLDRTLKVVMDWIGTRNDTLVIIVPDHAHGVAVIGTVRDEVEAEQMRDKVSVYADAGFPNYPAPDARGYPPSVDVSRRLAMFYASFPDHYESFRPNLEGQRVPAVRSGAGGPIIANERNNVPGAMLRIGNLPRDAEQGVHSVDDVILRAAGPGADRLHGFVDNTFVFRAMAEALGLGRN